MQRVREGAVLSETVALSVRDLTAWNTATIIVGSARDPHHHGGLMLKGDMEEVHVAA